MLVASETTAMPFGDMGHPSTGASATVAHNKTLPALGSPEFATLCKQQDSRSLGYRFIKRAFDICFALIVLAICLLLWPVTVSALAAIAISTKANPFYIQKRIGRFGKEFPAIKIRTMVRDAENVRKYLNDDQLDQWHRERKVDNDPRITKLGRILRVTSIDEAPQFINVLVGQMSVIGPRPITRVELEWYSPEEKCSLLSVPQGITGWWQVGARSDASYENGERQMLELEYCNNPSLRKDLAIFLRTFETMFGREKSGR